MVANLNNISTAFLVVFGSVTAFYILGRLYKKTRTQLFSELKTIRDFFITQQIPEEELSQRHAFDTAFSDQHGTQFETQLRVMNVPQEPKEGLQKWQN